MQELYAQATAPAVPRSREEITRFFDSLELVRPGIVDAACWRTGPLPARPGRALLLGGMARKRRVPGVQVAC
ncbi:MAG: SAM-dependent methyltransferase [Actinomycetota bacterium]|nr:SAM-dependent methyltransferase [Actinomycetota bacterium]